MCVYICSKEITPHTNTHTEASKATPFYAITHNSYGAYIHVYVVEKVTTTKAQQTHAIVCFGEFMLCVVWGVCGMSLGWGEDGLRM